MLTLHSRISIAIMALAVQESMSKAWHCLEISLIETSLKGIAHWACVPAHVLFLVSLCPGKRAVDSTRALHPNTKAKKPECSERTCACTFTCMHTYINTHAHEHIRLYLHVDLHVYAYVCINICTHLC